MGIFAAEKPNCQWIDAGLVDQKQKNSF